MKDVAVVAGFGSLTILLLCMLIPSLLLDRDDRREQRRKEQGTP